LPMPDALRLASAASRDPYVTSLCQGAAERVSHGAELASALHGFWMPTTLTRLVEWGERTSELPKALEMGREVFAARFTQQTELTRLVLPPIIFVLVAATVLFTMSSMVAILRLIIVLAS
jgi:type II secretory pathway component PulF